MSFASILSEPAVEAPKKSSPPSNQARASFESNHVASPLVHQTPTKSEEVSKSITEIPRSKIEKPSRVGVNGVATVKPKKAKKVYTDKENEKINREMDKIEMMDHSDLDNLAFDYAKEEYKLRGAKRSLGVNDAEKQRRKVHLPLINTLDPVSNKVICSADARRPFIPTRSP